MSNDAPAVAEADPPVPAGAASRLWTGVFVFLALGYICMGRSFAYWGIPQWKLFVGEAFLGWFLLLGPISPQGRWPWAAMRGDALGRFRRVCLLSLAFGVFQVIRGIVLGHPPVDALRDFGFNYYALYFFLGLWVGLCAPRFLDRILPLAGWASGVYGILYILVLGGVQWSFPGVTSETATVRVFGQPEYSAALLIGLLSLRDAWRRYWPILLLNAAVLIGMLIRGQWLAFLVALLLWAWLTKSFKKVALSAAAVVLPVAILHITDFSIPGPESRGGTISSRDLVGRVIAPFAPDVAGEFTADAKMNFETATFRSAWWLEIWTGVHQDAPRALVGYGYGFPLGNLVPYLQNSTTRTPHNALLFAVGYSGWIGLLIFLALQLELARMLWRVFRATGETVGLVFWAAEVAYSFATAFFEAPYGAIPFYLVVGCACAGYVAVEARDGVCSAEPESARGVTG